MTEVAVKQANLAELGSMLGSGLPFVGGDIDKALGIVIAKHEGEEVIVQRHIAAVEANEEAAIAAKDEVPEVKIVVGEDIRTELLGAIASLPQLRSLFAEQVADMINEGREGDEGYKEKVEKLAELRIAVGDMRKEILDFDQANVEGFVIEDLVSWSPDWEVSPKSFNPLAVSSGTRRRATSTVKWSLPEYAAKQGNIEGPEGSYHNVRLEAHGNSWVGRADEGVVATESSPNKVMKAILVAVGLSPARSANDFWGGSEAEKHQGV